MQRMSFLLLLLLLLQPGAAGQVGPLETGTLYAMQTFTLTAVGSYGNPYTDVVVTAVFTAPDASTVTVRGYWESGDTWKVRWTPTQTGSWSYAISSAPVDAGLAGSGSITVGAAEAGDSGFLRVNEDRRFTFQRDDGTPFFTWGMTYYEIVAMALINDNWKAAVDGTAAHGFTKIRMLVFPWPSYVGEEWGQPFEDIETPFDDRPNDILNTGYWAKLDEVVAYISAAGLVADLVFYGADELTAYDNPGSGSFTAKDRRFVSYIVARYGAHPDVIFNLTNEWQYSPYSGAQWSSLAASAVSENAPRRPLSIHQRTQLNFEFGNESWATHSSVQYGIRNRTTFNGDVWGSAVVAHNNTYCKPVVNDEYGYTGESWAGVDMTRFMLRSAAWGTVMTGGYGSTADGYDYADGPGGALGWPGRTAVWHAIDEWDDVAFMASYLTALDGWQNFRPLYATTSPRTYVFGHTGWRYVVYSAAGSAWNITVTEGEYTVEKVKADGTGAGSESNVVCAASACTYTYAPSSGDDWVYLFSSTAETPPALDAVTCIPRGSAPPPPTSGPCVNWNLRGGCGPDDHFVELYFRTQTSLAGWRIEVGECSYTFAEDALAGPFKVTFADMAVDCNGFPLQGVAVVYGPDNSIRDFRSFLTLTSGHSWQATTSTEPFGSWRSAYPNPGE